MGKTSLADRIWSHAVIQPDGCLYWDGYIDRDGYATTKIRGMKTGRVSKIAYELWYPPVPDGLVMDHRCHSEDLSCPGGRTCKHRRCVNPDHLEPVTRKVNSQRGVQGRKNFCDHNHEFTPENTMIRKNGTRRCRECNRITCHEQYLKRPGKPGS